MRALRLLVVTLTGVAGSSAVGLAFTGSLGSPPPRQAQMETRHLTRWLDLRKGSFGLWKDCVVL